MSQPQHSVTTIELKRDCEAVQIPAGATVVLPQGIVVDITQQLGGTYTVHAQGGLYRITQNNADALGLETAPEASGLATGLIQGGGGEISDDQIWAVLKTCYDPEIPVNIVDLGLVYSMTLEPLPSGNWRVDVKMTLTAPGCGMGPSIAGDAQQKMLMLDSVEEAQVEIVWDPVWNHDRISPEGRRVLGID